MTIVAINDSIPEGRRLMGIINRSARKTPGVLTIHDDPGDGDDRDEILDSLPFERIPGLAYTDQERIASILEGTQAALEGRYRTIEQVRAMFPRQDPSAFRRSLVF